MTENAGYGSVGVGFMDGAFMALSELRLPVTDMGFQLADVLKIFPNTEVWEEKNLFFGGVHSVRFDAGAGRFDGAGDSRRGGVALIV